MVTPHRIRTLALPAFLTLLAGFGVWAIVQDRYPTFVDSILADSVTLHDALTGSEVTPKEWMEATKHRPPLSYLLGSLLYFVDRPNLALLRFSVLVQFLFGIWLVAGIGTLIGGRRAGLLSAVLVGTLPMVYGWGRMAYMDTTLSVTVLLCLWLLLRCNFNNLKHGGYLGVGVGLGLLAKAAFPIFAIGPLIWTVARRVRTRRNLAVLALSVGAAVVVAGWWYIPHWEQVVTKINDSLAAETTRDLGWVMLKVSAYFGQVAAGGWLLVAGLGLGIAAMVLGTARRDHLALLLVSVVIPLIILIFSHHLRRHALPLYPLLGLLFAVSLDGLITRFAPRLTPALTGAISGYCLLEFLLINLGSLQLTMDTGVTYHIAGPRVDGVGLVTPNRRSHDSYPMALAWAKRLGLRRCMVIYDAEETVERHGGLLRQLELELGKPPLELVTSHRAFVKAPSNKPCLLYVRDHRGTFHWNRRVDQRAESVHQLCLNYAWFLKLADSSACTEQGIFGPSLLNLSYVVYTVDATAIRKVPRPSKVPTCKR